MNPPSPAVISIARASAGLTQAAAARLVHQPQPRWAEYESGARAPDPARWELFLILTGQHPGYQVIRKPT